MNLNELNDILVDLESIVYSEKPFGQEVYRIENDRPRGMKKTEWDKLVCAVDDLSFKIKREIINEQKRVLMS
jgi:hypothetical protein